MCRITKRFQSEVANWWTSWCGSGDVVLKKMFRNAGRTWWNCNLLQLENKQIKKTELLPHCHLCYIYIYHQSVAKINKNRLRKKIRRWGITSCVGEVGIWSAELKAYKDNFFFCMLPACRRLLFPLLHPFPSATKEIGDVCTQASLRVNGRYMSGWLGIQRWTTLTEQFLVCLDNLA